MMMRRTTLGVRTLHRSLVAATMVMIVMGSVGMMIAMVVEGVPVHLGLVWLQDFFQKSLSHQKESYYFILLNKICL